MRSIVTFIFVWIVCFVGVAKEFINVPQFSVGEMLKYRTTARVTMYIEEDSLVITTKMLTSVTVDSKNDKGVVLSTVSRLEDYTIDCSNPEGRKELEGLSIKREQIEATLEAQSLIIQLDLSGRADSILNLEKVKERMLELFLNTYAGNAEVDSNEDFDVDNTMRVLIKALVDKTCKPDLLIAKNFNNFPYFKFNGVPLRSGTIPASIIINEELKKFTAGLSELNMNITGSGEGDFAITINGLSDTAEVDCVLNFSNGIISKGYLSVSSLQGSGMSSRFTIEAL